MADLQPLAPADLLIDEENPRISQPNAGQQRALQTLAQHLDRKLVVLAGHIVQHGIDPSTLPIVMPVLGMPVRYIVLEGNRRLAALRALENPESVAEAVTPKVLKALRRLSRQYQDNPIETVNCIVMKDREAARPWIELRHTGANDGAGVMSWGADEAARFKARSGVREPHTQALDFLQQRGDLTPEVRRKLPTTSLKRLLETPDVRSRLGVEVQRGVLSLLADEAAVARALMHVVNDLTSGRTKVSDIYTTGQRQKYAKELPTDVVVKPTVKSGHGVAASSSASPATAKRKAARRATVRKRDRLIPKDCVLNIPTGRIQDIEGELRKLSLEDTTNAVSVLFRVFVELSVDAYLTDHPISGVTDDDKLRKKIEKVSLDLEAKRKLNKQQARAIRSANMDHSFLAPGVNQMNDYIHNEHIFPSPSDLRAAWNSVQPFVAAMWTP
jgi:hypothetical protein